MYHQLPLRPLLLLALSVLATGLACNLPFFPSGRPPLPVTEAPLSTSAPVQASVEPGVRTLSAAEALPLAYTAAATIRDGVETLANTCVTGVFIASEQRGGQLTTTGTLSEDSQGNAQYRVTPSDALHIELRDGREVVCGFKTLDGYFAESADDFFSNDYDLVLTKALVDGYDLAIDASRRDRRGTWHVTGMFFVGDAAYQIDARENGTTDFDFGSGFEQTEDSTARGSVTGPDFALTYDETYSYHAVYFDNLVSNINRRLDAELTTGADTYTLVGVTTRQSFFNGVPDEIGDYWLAEGAIVRNDAPYGELQLTVSNLELVAVLVTDDERIVLQSWPR